MNDRELMQQALDALDLLARYENPATKVQVRKPRDGGPIVTMYPHKVATEAAVPLRARLAQPEPEPVAYDINGATVYIKPPVYTAPPQREWQGLTDEEQLEIMKMFGLGQRGAFADAIEAKLKEKNT